MALWWKYDQIMWTKLHGFAFQQIEIWKQIGFLKSKHNGTLRQNFPKFFTDEFIETFNWDGIGRNKFAIRHRVFISHILYGLCFYRILFYYFFFHFSFFDSSKSLFFFIIYKVRLNFKILRRFTHSPTLSLKIAITSMWFDSS